MVIIPGPPVKICDPLSVLQLAPLPVFLVRPFILTKFGFTSCVPMDKTTFPAWECVFPRRKALFEAWDRQSAEMVGLGTVFPCVPTHVNPCIQWTWQWHCKYNFVLFLGQVLYVAMATRRPVSATKKGGSDMYGTRSSYIKSKEQSANSDEDNLHDSLSDEG